MGRPIILPRTNVGHFVRNQEEAWVLPKVDALGIVDAVRTLRANEQMRERLSAGALEFCRSHFNWSTNAAKLEQFYFAVLARTKPQSHAAAAKIST